MYHRLSCRSLFSFPNEYAEQRRFFSRDPFCLCNNNSLTNLLSKIKGRINHELVKHFLKLVLRLSPLLGIKIYVLFSHGSCRNSIARCTFSSTSPVVNDVVYLVIQDREQLLLLGAWWNSVLWTRWKV